MTSLSDMAFIDPNNPLLSATIARLDTGIVAIGDQQLGIATVRTPSTTLSVDLTAEAADEWADHLHTLAEALRGDKPSKLIAADTGDVAALEAMRQPRG